MLILYLFFVLVLQVFDASISGGISLMQVMLPPQNLLASEVSALHESSNVLIREGEAMGCPRLHGGLEQSNSRFVEAWHWGLVECGLGV